MPYIGVDARVIDPDTGQVLGTGQTGEIVVNGPQVFQGYWGRPQDTEAAFILIEGKRFFRTGDLGQFDDQGYYTMVDRLKRMINASGLKVWPAEVENMLFAADMKFNRMGAIIAHVWGIPGVHTGSFWGDFSRSVARDSSA